jgi:hypothetical protein
LNLDGLLIGFIDRWTEGVAGDAAEGQLVEVIPPNGPPISLLKAPAQLVEVKLSGLSFVVPLSFKLVFVESGSQRVRMGIPGVPVLEVLAKVRALAQGDDYLLYHLSIENVPNQDLYRVIIDGLAH